MFTIFDIACYAIPAVIFAYFGGPQIVSEVAITKYYKFRMLNSFVGKQQKGALVILWISIVLIVKAMIYNFSQWINKTVVKKGDNYEVTYFIKGNKYIMRIPNKDVSPSPVFLITGDNDADITEEVEPFLGPYNNFHGISVTPSSFNQLSLSIETIDGKTRVFNRNDLIVL